MNKFNNKKCNCCGMGDIGAYKFKGARGLKQLLDNLDDDITLVSVEAMGVIFDDYELYEGALMLNRDGRSVGCIKDFPGVAGVLDNMMMLNFDICNTEGAGGDTAPSTKANKAAENMEYDPVPVQDAVSIDTFIDEIVANMDDDTRNQLEGEVKAELKRFLERLENKKK